MVQRHLSVPCSTKDCLQRCMSGGYVSVFDAEGSLLTLSSCFSEMLLDQPQCWRGDSHKYYEVKKSQYTLAPGHRVK